MNSVVGRLIKFLKFNNCAVIKTGKYICSVSVIVCVTVSVITSILRSRVVPF